MQTNEVWLGSAASQEPVARLDKDTVEGRLLQLRFTDSAAKMYIESTKEEEFRPGKSMLVVQGGVAVVFIKGALVNNWSWEHEYYDITSYEAIRDAVTMAAEDVSVKRIVLKIESGGGSPVGLQALSKYIELVDKTVKPVYGHCSSCAYSAAYWLITACREISADPMAQLGSIGVVFTRRCTKEAHKKAGVEYKYFRSGEFKALGQEAEEINDKEKQGIMSTVAQLFEFFKAQVLAGRPAKAQSNMAEWIQGKELFSKECLDYGLIDSVNTFDDLVLGLYDSNKSTRLSTNSGTADMSNIKFLTPEQAVLLSGGAAPESVGMSDEQLEEYNANLQNSGESEEGEEESTEESTAPAEESTAPAEEEPTMQTSSDLADKVVQFATDLAASKLSLSQATAAKESLEAENTHLRDLQKKLALAVVESTNRMSIPLNKAKLSTENIDAESAANAYMATKEEFKQLFASGQTSSNSSASTTPSAVNTATQARIVRKVN